MKNLDRWKTDRALENDGAVLEVMDGVTMTVRSSRAQKVREWLMLRFNKRRSVFAAGATLSVADLDAIDIDKCAEVLVTGWEGITEDDTPIAFSVDAARALFTEIPTLREAVLAFANDLANFRAAEVAAVAKNSATPSMPSSGTAGVEA